MSLDETQFKLAKTEAGRAALAERTACTPRERQVLIMCDGERTVADFQAMLGSQAWPIIASLQQKGYVLSVTPMLARLAQFSHTGTMEWPDTAVPAEVTRPPATLKVPAPGRPAAARIAAEAPAQAAPVAARTPPRARRSLAATKMYLVDVFQKQREEASRAITLSLQRCSDEASLLEAMLPALKHLHAQSGASYASRVVRHLLDILPDELLSQFCEGVLSLDLQALTVASLLTESTAS
ncbi:hypothetical protein CCO03_06935 [Comamonas serinivorans]|uniref:Uncharacterized protein n=2 Tax=Comamonas serinivorans TaxID=1082851 RepID=A0A1Y0ELH0_9BURK|nr:hypothetical protein CCO03_06935 [Comamonas serinivorans]